MSPYRTPAERPDYTEPAFRPASAWRGWVPVVAVWLVASAEVGGLIACKPPKAPSTAAEAAYGAALLKCVDDAKTLADSKACRARVDAEWGVTQTARDAGKDGQ